MSVLRFETRPLSVEKLAASAYTHPKSDLIESPCQGVFSLRRAHGVRYIIIYIASSTYKCGAVPRWNVTGRTVATWHCTGLFAYETSLHKSM